MLNEEKKNFEDMDALLKARFDELNIDYLFPKQLKNIDWRCN